jgi:putative ABC transport system substrate-binding protein
MRRRVGVQRSVCKYAAMMTTRMVVTRIFTPGLTVLVALLLFIAPAAEGQPAGKVWRIGYLTPSDIPMKTLIAPLREFGYVEGRTARFEIRSAQDNVDRLPELAADLVRARVDIIVAVSPPAIVAAKRATTTIPIVMAFWGGEGLTESGVVASFSRPGGNVTGVYMLADELDVKRFELLLEAVPKTRTVAMLSPGAEWNLSHLTDDLRQIAETRRIKFLISDVPGADGYGATFAAMRKAKVEAVLVPSFPRFYREHLLIAEAAAKQRIPAIYEWGDMARAGGLMAYGPVIAELDRRVATYVDKILKGAKPGILPVEQPTKFELVINLKTAKALGITIPQALLLRADEVIQ